MNRRQFTRQLFGAAAVFQSVPGSRRAARFRNGGPRESKNFVLVRVSDSVFAVRGRDLSGIPTNSAVIVGESAIAVVDTHQQPSHDAEMRELIGSLSDLPIGFLINTHWHQDHTLGNQVFADVPIVAHEVTFNEMRTRIPASLELQRQLLPEQVDSLRKRLREIETGGPPGPALESARSDLRLYEAYLEELRQIRTTLPVRLFQDRTTVDIGGPRVDLIHLGRGHTKGDIVIHVPDEDILITGDLLTMGQPFMRRRDAVPGEWGPTLVKVAELRWKHAVIGHGWSDSPRDRIEILTRFLTDLMIRTRQGIEAGLPEEGFAKAVRARLLEHAPNFPYFFDSVIENIERAREELTGGLGL